MTGLERFTRAQDAPEGGIQTALRELRSGRKRSHWIWYVFPQLAGLGQSSTAQHYALCDAEEAADYLRHPVLRERWLAAATAVGAQLEAGVPLRALMGSEVDALKLVSSLTLFESIAKRLSANEPAAAITAVEVAATRILERLESQGFGRCTFTSGHTEQ
jgi:uncharacterized protein (DUF1810 family)